MLKVKDCIDLKLFEKFGFKPKYDCDTGEVLYYYKDYFTDRYHTSSGYEYKHYEIKINHKTIKIEMGSWLKKKKIKKYFVYDKPPIYKDGFGMFVDLLFDLIQAGLVEKVGD